MGAASVAGPLDRIRAAAEQGRALASQAGRVLDTAGPQIDRLVSVVSPERAEARAKARRTFAALHGYEAAAPSRHRKWIGRDNRSGDEVARGAAQTLRAHARHLERNHDLTSGAFDVLVNRTVGPRGIRVDFQVRNTEGELHAAFNAALLALWRDWKRFPECKRQWGWGRLQRMVQRSHFRDGEVFAQQLLGNVPQLDHGTTVPFSLEALEADFVPHDFEAPGIFEGIARNAWGRPTAYYVYKTHPGSRYGATLQNVKAVPADRMLHLAHTTRLSQLRGVTVLAPVLERISDLREYEDSEMIAAKVAANFAAYIKKGDASMYGGANGPSLGGGGGSQPRRELEMEAGLIFDDLAIGEEVGIIDSKRPNVGLEAFRNGQLKGFAAGIGAGYSSVSKDYNGSYSSQRQELVESQPGYAAMTVDHIDRFTRPVVESFIRMAVLSGAVTVPPDVDRATLLAVDYRGPVMPWIDPKKEMDAARVAVRAGFKSRGQVVRDLGESPDSLDREIEQERERARNAQLFFDSDAAVDASNAPAAAGDTDPDE